MKKYYSKQIFVLAVLLLFATAQFFLILRHKSPYVSDSYFYKHIAYQIKGVPYEEARQRIISQIDLSSADDITKNIFTSPEAYNNSYSFFTKRPLLPLIVATVSSLGASDYVAFLIPIFVGYIASIALSFFIFRRKFNLLFSTMSISALIAFYPFLDLSTYFLTDTIGFTFWLALLILIYSYLKKGRQTYFLMFISLLIVSLFNREQSLLILPMLLLSSVLLHFFKKADTLKRRNIKLLFTSAIIAALYILISFALHQKTLIDTIVYTKNSYGLTSNTATSREIINYLVSYSIKSHTALAKDLSQHHWWFLISLLGAIGFLKAIYKKPSLSEILIFASGVASYSAIFLYPVLSYRYFFPVVIMILYFCFNFLQKFFENSRVK